MFNSLNFTFLMYPVRRDEIKEKSRFQESRISAKFDNFIWINYLLLLLLVYQLIISSRRFVRFKG